MADETKFKHITVGDVEEDEIVIQAGSVEAHERATDELDSEPQESLQDVPADAAGMPEAAQDDAGAGDGSSRHIEPDDALLDAVGLDQDDISDEARQEFEKHARQAARRQESSAMITTEEDLHTKMPFANMQRTIVVLLLVLVVAFCIYWYASHGLAG